VDVKGKAVMILGGDPPIADPKDPSRLDPKMFLGPELSYYGRPSTKGDIAFVHGAARRDYAVHTARHVSHFRGHESISSPRNNDYPESVFEQPHRRHGRHHNREGGAISERRRAGSQPLVILKPGWPGAFCGFRFSAPD